MSEVIGVVQSTYPEGNKLKVDDIWYSNKFKEHTAKKGQKVKITFDKNENYKNQFWKKVEILNADSTGYTPKGQNFKDQQFPIPQGNYQIAIIRQNALTNAVAYHTSTATKLKGVGDIIETARQFAEFTSGAADAKAQEEADLADPPADG